MRITKEQLAERLNGREYSDETITEDISDAKESGLVIVYGSSDDLMELEGAISDEVSCYEGGEFRIAKDGPIPDWDDIDHDDEEECEKYFARKGTSKHKLKAVWHDSGNPSWSYFIDVPFAEFDILEDGEKYCRGIVFSFADL